MGWGKLALLVGGALVLTSKRDVPTATAATPTGPGPKLRKDVPLGELEPAVAPDLPEPGAKVGGYPGAAVEPGGPVNVQLPKGNFYAIKRPGHAWGTASAIDSLVLGLNEWLGLAPAYNVQDWTPAIWDISKPGGGFLHPHVSHQEGRDVDINFVLDKGEETWRKLLTLPLIPLLIAFLFDANTEVIFLDWNRQQQVWDALDINPDLPFAADLKAELQYPLPKYKGKSRVRHSPGHDNHIHVRFRA